MKELLSQLSYLKISFCLLLSLVYPMAQGQIVVSIQDENNSPLIGVEVFTNEFEFSTITDLQGKFSLPDNFSHDEKINLRFLGFKSLALTIQQITDLDNLVTLVSGITLDEVTVVGRNNISAQDMANAVTSIDPKVFALSNPQTAADALGKHSEVFIQKSQMGGGSPIIRGFEANKVLLVLDGVRMNNAIYRSGHLQNAVTVDNAMLESIEVIYGPGSLMYGSDALGGVIHFRSKSPKLNFLNDGKILSTGNYYARFASANSEKSLHLDLNVGGLKLASLTSISVSSFGELMSGTHRPKAYPDFGKRNFFVNRINGEDVVVSNKNPSLQVGTAYDQLDLLQKFTYKLSDDVLLSANLQLSTSSDVPRYDNLSEVSGDGMPSYAEWYYGPQKRLLSSLRVDLYKSTFLYDKAIVIAAFQKISEDRIDRRFQSLNKGYSEEDLNIFSVSADFHKPIPPFLNSVLTYGLEFSSNDLRSIAYEENIVTKEKSSDIFSRYPSGGSGMKSVAGYIYLKFPFARDRGHFFTGSRFTSTGLDVKFLRTDLITWPEEFYSGLQSSNSALTWSLGSNIKAWTGSKLQFMVSSAFRSPNIDDLAKTRVQNNEVAIPNLNLNPEKSTNYEFTLQQLLFNSTQIGITTFYTSLTDIIVRDDFALPNGSTFLIDEGDTLKTVANINATAGKIYGLSINLKSKLSTSLHFEASYNYIKGRAIDSDQKETPLSHIPPAYGKIGLLMKYGKTLSSINCQFNGEKPIDDFGGSEDNPELATIDGSYAWAVINFNCQIPIYNSIQLSLGVENVLDKHYRPFSSGVSAPGRNFIVSVRGGF